MHEQPTTPTESEIEDLYKQMGLASAADRARFDTPQHPAPKVTLDVTISNTSNPFSS